jgi:hypothetical protein
MLLIPEPRLENVALDKWRLTASIAGTEVFIEASVPLLPRPEVLLCPFFFAAMAQHANLEVSGPVSPRLLENLAFARQRGMEWWPQLSGGEVRAWTEVEGPKGADNGLFFTGGADSSYALQQLHGRIRYAVFVEGFDIPLHDSARLRAARNWLSATTAECGVEFMVIRTNLREHPVFAGLSWEITHVSALAGVAHALGQRVRTMHVAASDVPPPWGSAPDLDAAWSSESMKVENFGAELTRLQRVAAIALWKPLRGRLRVCWENNTDDLNCGFCEKCLRTRMALYVSGAHDGLESFPADYPLRSTIKRLQSVPHELHAQWREIAARLDDPGLRKEVQRLLMGASEL